MKNMPEFQYPPFLTTLFALESQNNVLCPPPNSKISLLEKSFVVKKSIAGNVNHKIGLPFAETAFPNRDERK